METLGAPELLIVLLLALLFFGANKLPEIGTGLGTAIRSFRSGLKDDETTSSDHR
jgi:sec-independent protein translocase protein TatA